MSEDIYKSVTRLFKISMHEYGKNLVAENMLDASTDESINEGIMYWVERLREENMSAERIEVGIERMKRDPEFKRYPPKLRQFVELCRLKPEDLKLPSVDVAYRIATGDIHVDKIPPALKWAIERTGHWNLIHSRSDNSDNVKSVFIEHYQKAIDMSSKGAFKSESDNMSDRSRVVPSMSRAEQHDAISKIDSLLARLSETGTEHPPA